MGFFDAPPATTNQATTVANGLPDWYQQYVSGIGGMAANYANQPYTPYTGARVAGLSSGQQTAMGGLSSMVTNPNPTQKWTDPGVASSYMSPYTSGVVDDIARRGNQNFNQNVMPGIQSQFVGAGGSGSTRNADILSKAAVTNQANISGLQSNALQAGYGTGANIFGADQSRQQQGQALQMTGLGLLGQMGQTDQATQQKALDTAYGDFTDQRDWDINNAGKLNSVVKGLALPQSSQSISQATTQGGGSSPAQGFLQFLATLYGTTQ